MLPVKGRVRIAGVTLLVAAAAGLALMGASGWPGLRGEADRVSQPAPAPAGLSYDQAIMANKPVAYWPLGAAAQAGTNQDMSGHQLHGTFFNNPAGTLLPNGEAASLFNGTDQYFEVGDDPLLEVTKTGILTIEAWMRPDVLEFPKGEGSGYVHWMGKGSAQNQSWVARIYSKTNTENRPNRISGYLFNKSGGLGVGSYFQEPVTAGEWIHYTLVINTANTSESFPRGYTKIYKNGQLKDTDSLVNSELGTMIPEDGTAKTRIGTRDAVPNKSWFKGAVGKVAIFDYELTGEQIAAHYGRMK